MRPCRSTCVASTTTRPAPELASMPRCIRCQSVAEPSSAEYWHIGETAMRFASSRPASRIGEKRALVMGDPGRRAGRRSALLDGLQIGDDGTDLVGVKLEFRHIGMAGEDALAQRLLERFHRIALAEHAKQRRLLARACAAAADGMAAGAVLLQQLFAELEVAVVRLQRPRPGDERNDGGERGQPQAAARSRLLRGFSGMCCATRRSTFTTLIASSIRTANWSCVGKYRLQRPLR